MIVKEYYKTRSDGVVLNRIYSDMGFLIQKENTNEIYEEAIDVDNAPFSYIETDKLIPEKPVLHHLKRREEVKANGTENN